MPWLFARNCWQQSIADSTQISKVRSNCLVCIIKFLALWVIQKTLLVSLAIVSICPASVLSIWNDFVHEKTGVWTLLLIKWIKKTEIQWRQKGWSCMGWQIVSQRTLIIYLYQCRLHCKCYRNVWRVLSQLLTSQSILTSSFFFLFFSLFFMTERRQWTWWKLQSSQEETALQRSWCVDSSNR